MIPMSSGAELSLVRSHAITCRAVAITQTQGRLELPISEGEVRGDSNSQVRRTARLTVPDQTLWPLLPSDPLSPMSAELSIEFGVVLPSGSVEYLPIFYGIITGVDLVRPTGAIQIEAADRSLRVAEYRLDGPRALNTAATIVSEITALIQETIAGVTVQDRTGSVRMCPAMTVERERWFDGVEKLADALAAEVYADTTGGFVIRNQSSLSDTAVWTVSSGDDGVLITAAEKVNRELVYNRVIADGTPSGSDPVRGIVTNTDTSSPSYWGGPFGKRPRFYTSPLLTTVAQCEQAAAGFLARSAGAQQGITMTTLVHPGLEPGDVLRVILPGGRTQKHIIDSVSIPLTPDSAQSITTRSTDIGS